MNKRLIGLYHRLPFVFRSVATSVYGYHLRSWRYGSDTEELVKAALERETWSYEDWKKWQAEKLQALLYRAVTKVPYYRNYWQNRRKEGDEGSWEKLQNWPVLSKVTVRNHAELFLAEDCNSKQLLSMYTSGSSGTPLHLWIGRTANRYWYALFRARWQQWYGVTPQDRLALFSGQLIVPVTQRTPPFWVWNQGLNQLHMSTYHISRETTRFYAQAIRKYRIAHLYGQAAAMYTLAHFIKECNLSVPQLKVIVSSAEPLFDYQRRTLEEVFQCSVRDSYGMAEKVTAASECEGGALHLWPEAGVVEIMADDADQVLPYGRTGRIICTGLINTDMPLIRYEVGDRGRLVAPDLTCDCGRTLPMIEAIEGRLDDVIVTPDGRRIGRLSPSFKGDLAIREAQVIQETLSMLKVNVVPTEGYTNKDRENIIKNLKERVGDMIIEVHEVEYIPRGPNGKFRAVISKVGGS